MVTQEFISYIKNALAQGQTKESLMGPLMGAGWTLADIQEVFKIVVPPAQGPVPLTPKGPVPMPIPTPMTKPNPVPSASSMPSPVAPTPVSMPTKPVTPPVFAPASAPIPQMQNQMPKPQQSFASSVPLTPKAPAPVSTPVSPSTPAPVSSPASSVSPASSMSPKPAVPPVSNSVPSSMSKPASMPVQQPLSRPAQNFSGMPMETPVIKKSNSSALVIFIIFVLVGGLAFAGWYLYRPQIENLLGINTTTKDTSEQVATTTPAENTAPVVPPAPADQTPTEVNIPPVVTTAPQAVNLETAPTFNTYQGKGFSFKYDSKAKETTQYGSFGPYHVINIAGGSAPDMLSFFRGAVPDDANMCSDANVQRSGIEVKTTVINGKTFTYCDSKGEPDRAYIYVKDGKTMVINVPQTSSKPETGYVDLGSVEIQ